MGECEALIGTSACCFLLRIVSCFSILKTYAHCVPTSNDLLLHALFPRPKRPTCCCQLYIHVRLNRRRILHTSHISIGKHCAAHCRSVCGTVAEGTTTRLFLFRCRALLPSILRIPRTNLYCAGIVFPIDHTPHIPNITNIYRASKWVTLIQTTWFHRSPN